MVLGLYKLSSAIERGTKPSSLAGKPYHHTLGALPNQGLKGVVRPPGRGTIPRDYYAPLVQEQTSCVPNNPAVV